MAKMKYARRKNPREIDVSIIKAAIIWYSTCVDAEDSA